MFKRCVAALCLLAGPALAGPFVFPDDPDEADFISGEVIATFYHELGHALIDVLQVPVLGKEEDAADTLSVILMHDGWQEEAATAILTADATSYALRAGDPNMEPAESSFADVQSLDIQRYYAVVCLFYGANPDQRRQLALDLELPEEKLESCPYEYDQARAAWGTVLDQAVPGPETAGLVMAPGQEGQPLADLLAEEVAALNEVIGLPVEVTVVVADCGEANAFYSTGDKTITMCNEYAEDLQALWEANPE